jgi:hypothetical protein
MEREYLINTIIEILKECKDVDLLYLIKSLLSAKS